MKKDRNCNYLGGILAILFLFLGISPLSAQNITVRGIVTDAQNEPLIGATIIVQGTSNGTVTDIDGNYVLNNVPSNGTLEASYVGMRTQTIAVNGRTRIDVRMEEDSELLEEVVITGYGGTQLRSKSTNSIAKVDSKTFAKGVFSNPAQALSGAVAGVRVIQSSGNPGSAPTIILRGGTNFDGSGSPLVIVDGMVRSGLNDINPDDIESMEVMKDAGATAIYGARANNGVILITTKRGKTGTSSIDLKVRYGMNYLNNPYKFVNARDYLYYMRNAYKTASQYFQIQRAGEPDPVWVGVTNMNSLGNAVAYGTGNIYWTTNAAGERVPANGLYDNRAVWSPMKYTKDLEFLLSQGWEKMQDPVYDQEIIFKNWDMIKANVNTPVPSQDYNLGFSGGNEKGHYYANIGYNRSKGMPLGNEYNRLTFTVNADYKIRDWLTSYTNIAFADAKWKGMPPTQASEANYFSRMFSAPPTMRGYNADGELLLGQNSGDGNQAVNIDKFIRRNNTDKFTLGQNFQVSFTKNLYLRTSATWYYEEELYESFNRDYMQSTNNWNRTRSSSASFARKLDQTYNAVLNYNNTFGLHTVEGLTGAEYYDSYQKGLSASGSGAPTDDFMDLGLTSTEAEKRNIDSYHIRQRILSFFGRVNYDYDAKYLLSVVFRQDGYSRLLGNNRWGFFPGVSAGWVFTKEDFAKNFSDNIALSFGKLRVSYGLNGNVSGQVIGAYTLQGSYYTTNYAGQTGYLMGNIPNPYLRWEKSRTFEAGLDLGFLSNKITTNWTYYNRTTTDKYANIPLPGSSGLNAILSNNGEIRNSGLEVQMDYFAINTKDWQWNISLNAAYNKNIITKLPDNGLERNRQNAFQVYSGNANELIWVGGYQEGQEPGVLYAFKAEGIYKSYDEIPGNLIDRTSGNNGSNGLILYGPEAWAKLTDAEKVGANGNAAALPIQPGDVKWRDVNGDGVIDNYDMIKIGNTRPRWTGGFNTTLSFKDFTFGARLDYGLGFYIADWRTPWILGNMQGTFSTLEDVKQTWSTTNPNGTLPQYTWADQLNKRNYARESSMFMYKGDYLAIRELSLTYTLPKNISSILKMTNLDFSVTGQNLGYFTQGKNLYNPEQSSSGGYPLPRTIIFGLNASF